MHIKLPLVLNNHLDLYPLFLNEYTKIQCDESMTKKDS